jgi:nucleoside-diphosphate-sugar epimerase
MIDVPAETAPRVNRHRILVVGGTGHVGAALAVHLSGQGHHVVATGRRLPPPLGDPQIQTVTLDLARPDLDDRIGLCDTAILCPWVLEGEASSDWVTAMTTGLQQLGVGSVLYFSSMWVYGEPLAGTLTERNTPRPTSFYGAAHLANELALTDSGARLDLDISIIRMSNLIGPDPLHRHRSKVSFAHEMAAMAISEQKIVLRSSPSTPRDLLTRSRLHHDVDALIDRSSNPGRIEILNAGGDRTTTVGAFAHRIAKVATEYHGLPVSIEHPEDPSDQMTFVLDSQKLRSIAGPCLNNLDREISMVFDDVRSMASDHP